MSRTILITGAGSGLGLEAARQFADRGWNIVATLRDPARLDPELAGRDSLLALRVDVTDPRTAETAVRQAVERFGGIDVVLNNAGYAQLGAVEEVSLAQARDQFETNVLGVMAVLQAVLPHLRERRSGHILNVSSMGAVEPLPTMGIYCASKAALDGLTLSLARELEPLGIKVTIVEPAGMGTPFMTNARRPAHAMPQEYSGAYGEMRDFAERRSRHADVTRSVAAIADVAGSADAPTWLAAGSFGLEMARDRIARQLDDYATWEKATLATD